jgi:hypothetical protein
MLTGGRDVAMYGSENVRREDAGLGLGDRCGGALHVGALHIGALHVFDVRQPSGTKR